MKKFELIALVLVSIVLPSSCVSTGFLMAKPKVTLFKDAHPPKNKGEKIDVYVTTKPSVDYLEFALITCGDTDDKWNLEQITNKAREIGADGIVIIGKAGSMGIGQSLGDPSYNIGQEYGMTAIAIKYK